MSDLDVNAYLPLILVEDVELYHLMSSGSFIDAGDGLASIMAPLI
jgi:hypothetical protein